MSIEELEQQRDMAVGRYHAVQRDFANELAAKYAVAQIRAVAAARAALAEFQVDLLLWNKVEYDKGVAKLVCSLIPHGIGISVEFPLTAEEGEALARNKGVADALWMESRRLDREIIEAERAAYQERVPLDFDGLLAKAERDHEEQEEFYIENGPRKHEQEDYTGPQVVKMNVDLLSDWLDDDSDAFEELDVAQRREIWEASAFHFGIMGYKDADADFYWQNEAR